MTGSTEHGSGLERLRGRGGVADAILSRDWTATPLGPPETWDPVLMTMLVYCLDTKYPAALFWGPEFRVFGNDAFAALVAVEPGAAMADADGALWQSLAAPLREGLASGTGASLMHHPLTLVRDGAARRTTWSMSLVPARYPDGSVAGLVATARETTDEVQAQARTALLLDLAEIERANRGIDATVAAAVRAFATAFGVDRAGVGQRTGEDAYTISAEYVAPGMKSLGTVSSLDAYGPTVAQILTRGGLLRVDDIQSDPRFDEAARAQFDAAGIRASIVVPWMEGDRLTGSLFLSQRTARAWTPLEVATAEEMLGRLRNLIAHERAADRERALAHEIDHRARNALAVAQSVVRLSPAADVDMFRETVEQRIGILSAAHALLADGGWTSVPIGRLIDIAAALGRPAVDVVRQGDPATPLPAPTVQSVALILHEILTRPGLDRGFRLSWQTDASGLTLDWIEGGTDGPSPLLRRLVEGQLHGSIGPVRGGDGWRIQVPFATAPASADRPVERLAGGDAPARAKGLRVMIVEDEALIAMDLEATVEALGHEVIAVPSRLSDALDRLATLRPDIALLDGNLRGESSVPLAERLHALGVPVVFVTGYEQIENLPEALLDAPVLTKPVSEPSLAAALRAAADLVPG